MTGDGSDGVPTASVSALSESVPESWTVSQVSCTDRLIGPYQFVASW